MEFAQCVGIIEQITAAEVGNSTAPAKFVRESGGTPPVGVTVIVPNSMTAGTSTGVTITGSGFAFGASVTFENGSGRTPTASAVVVMDATTITATVSVSDKGRKGARVWDVRVTNTGGSTGVLLGGFTVIK